jgi:hypothetical protein
MFRNISITKEIKLIAALIFKIVSRAKIFLAQKYILFLFLIENKCFYKHLALDEHTHLC